MSESTKKERTFLFSAVDYPNMYLVWEPATGKTITFNATPEQFQEVISYLGDYTPVEAA